MMNDGIAPGRLSWHRRTNTDPTSSYSTAKKLV
jgi:hypothetical protein